MASLNRVTLIGNLGHDPEIRETSRGASVANISVATTQRWTDPRTGEKRERTEWHRVVLWGRTLIELAQKHLATGSAVYVEGSLQTRQWQDGDGNNRQTTEIRAQRIQLLGSSRVASAADGPSQRGQSTDKVEPNAPASHEAL
jgi:single-strand DNA-binding protein